MTIKDTFNKLKQEAKVVQGEETKDKRYCSSHTLPDAASAGAAFEESKRRLFNVNLWSDLKGLNSTFELYDQRGRRTTAEKPEIGYYMRILLPGPTPENWVQVTDINEAANSAEFTVSPSEKPSERHESDPVIEHFFIKEATSTFRVELKDKELIGCEIGRNEGINNQGYEAGDRAIINTLIAEGGWAGFQGLQWDKLMRYIVQLEEPKDSK